MKQIYWLLFVAVAIFSSCGQKSPEGFVVKGQINNAAGKTLILNEIKAQDVEMVDSVTLDADGKFEFTGKNAGMNFYQLQLAPENLSVFLLVDSLDAIELKADAEKLVETYEVSGNEDSKLLAELEKQIRKSQLKVDSLGMLYNELKDVANQDSVKQLLDERFLAILEEQKAYSKAFINKNSTSLASMLAISQQIAPNAPVLNAQADLEVFEKVSQDLSEKYPNNESVKGLKKYVEQVKNPQQELEGVSIGAEAPNIELPTPDGKTLSLSSLRGNYVLLDFWAAWCRPCRVENPNLVDNHKKYNPKGFQIFQVSLDRTAEEWKEAIEKDGLNWHHVSDLKFWQSEAAQLYNVRSIPASYLIDPEGKVIARNLRGPALGQKLQELYGF